MEITKKPNKTGKLVYSLVALSLLLMLLLTATKAWISVNLSSAVESAGHYLKIDADSGLNVNYGTDDVSEGVIDLDTLFAAGQLTPCSSIDGKRIFFPLSDYATNSDSEFVNNFNTKDAVYRESTVLDKNTKYISVDLELESKAKTDVWFDNEKTWISSSNNHLANTIRIAIIENEPGGNALVFDNAPSGYNYQFTPIANLSADGKGISTDTIESHNIYDYQFGNPNGLSLFTLEANKPKSITVNIWLEGTDPQCNTSFSSDDLLNISINFSTSFEKTRPIYFVDYTREGWVEDDDVKLFVINSQNPEERKPMHHTDGTKIWSYAIPESWNEVTFARYNPNLPEDLIPEKWNTWIAGEIGDCNTYNAFGDAAEFADNNGAGIWSDDFSWTKISLFDGTQNGGLLSNENGSDGDTTYININVIDGNGVEQQIIYKMSFLADKQHWQIVIPTDTLCNEDYPIVFMDFSEQTSDDYTYYTTEAIFERGDSTYFTITYPGEGYWGNKLLYLHTVYEYQDENNKTQTADMNNSCRMAAHFYNDDGAILWSAMYAKASIDGRLVVAAPNDATGAVFCRTNPNMEEYDFFDTQMVYNRTYGDVHGKFNSNNLYKISGYATDGYYMTGQWYPTTNN